jgi:catechol 2,3-dioxygenase-like lactoylglutathione lyase family enzyme
LSGAAPPLRLKTVMLGVRDMDRAFAFYRDTLGLAVQFATGEFAFFDGGGVAVVLRLASDLPLEVDDRRVELVFHVEDVDAAHRALQERGVAFRVAPRIVTGDRLAADFRDPDGHVLSIFGPRRSAV